jgi:hypothetical protein
MRRATTLLMVGIAAILWSVAPAAAIRLSGRFVDDDTSVHETTIEALAEAGITKGCNPPANDRFCPSDPVRRGEMAAFLHRAFKDRLTPARTVDFADTRGSTFEADIAWLGSVGVTKGCNPPANDRFCPAGEVTRGQMASFLVRALGLTDRGDAAFVDDTASIYEADIERLATALITKGCNPPANDRFCPNEPVSRAQMASFLVRALDLKAHLPQLDLNKGWPCSKDGTVCTGAATAEPGRAMLVSEGWTNQLPFLTGEADAFRDPDTVFELWIDGIKRNLTPQPEQTSGGRASRNWNGVLVLPRSGTTTLEGRWFWQGTLIRRMRVTVTIS